MSITSEIRGRTVTAAEARESVRRLVNSHFHNPDSARVSIPADVRDDDLIASDYVEESAALSESHRELREAAKKAERCLTELYPSDPTAVEHEAEYYAVNKVLNELRAALSRASLALALEVD